MKVSEFWNMIKLNVMKWNEMKETETRMNWNENKVKNGMKIKWKENEIKWRIKWNEMKSGENEMK